MPQEVTLIDEGVDADTLTLPEVFERPAGMQAIAAHLELLAVACGVELIPCLTMEIGQFHSIHGLEHSVVGRLEQEHLVERHPETVIASDKRGPLFSIKKAHRRVGGGHFPINSEVINCLQQGNCPFIWHEPEHPQQGAQAIL